MNNLFTPFSFKGLHLKNRIVLPPMCQYSVEAKDGVPNEWHDVHYTSRAVGGAGLILAEMTDVEPDGRFTDQDLGIWSDEHIPAFKRLADSCHKYGAKFGIQIAHAGRKAEVAEVPVAPSAVRLAVDGYKTPRALETAEVKQMVEKFAAAARRAVQAGVDTVEIHAANGCLIHQFQSPLVNLRTDEYGQDKALFGVEVTRAMKAELPAEMPLILRISAVEYVENGYGLDYSIELCKRYKEAGVDIFHVASGGEGPFGSRGGPGTHAGFQVPLARAIKEALGVPVIAVGNLDDFAIANAVVCNDDADLVAVGRGMLRDPYWAHHAAKALGQGLDVPEQYARAF